MRFNWLHVYGQFCWHSEATIRGTRDGLIALRDAIDAAIETGSGSAEVIASDGEGYSVDVIRSSTVRGIGRPEYIMEREHELGKQELRRQREFKLLAARKEQKP